MDGRFRKVQAGVLVLLLRRRGRLSAPREVAVAFFPFFAARETTISTPGHITITRGSNGPSTRGAPGNADHVIWKQCFFACVRVVCCSGDSGTVSPLHASENGCANSGTAVGLCNGPYFVVQVSIFLHAVVGLQASPRSARRIGRATCQEATISENESMKVCVPLAHDSDLVDLLARKVVLWITPSGGKDAQTTVRRPLLDLWVGGQSEAELNKRLLAGLGELLRSVTSSLPACREVDVRDQQTQPQRHQQGKKNRRTKRKAERDNSLGARMSTTTGSRLEEPENPMLMLSRNAKKQLAIKPEGLHASHWKGTVVDLADFISRVSTAKTGDHIIAGVAAEEPPELEGLLVPDGISATLIALPSMKTSHPS